MVERTGWLLDVYPDMQNGVVLWLLGDDDQRYQLRQPFAVTFYVAGPASRLRALWRYLQDQSLPLQLSRTERHELFSHRALPVLAIQVSRPTDQPRLLQQIVRIFPDLTYYDADILLALRFTASYGVFPLARCQVVADAHGTVQEIRALDTPWEIDPPKPPLRILRLEPDVDPARRPPQELIAHFDRYTWHLLLQPERCLLVSLRAILERHDPDLLLTAWGDTWLLPYLLKCSRRLKLPLPLSRDPARQAAYRPERSYFSYGQVIYRGRQVHLFGRWHIDSHNAMLWSDYELEGALEVARVTSLPVQTAARVSPGTGISSMQILTALRGGILVPWHKQQAESLKSALEMFTADQGGLVYQPLIGLHRDVAEIDFVSMYPGIMVRFNISPETVGGQRPLAGKLVPVRSPENEARPGLVPQTLAPLLKKRLALKAQIASLPRWDARSQIYKARASAHKWLLVTCFGYLGYKNARFGRIEAHEAVTAYGREALLRAKETAEDLGFTVLHLYVDGMWVKKDGATTVTDFQPLLDAIVERTSLPIALDGIYRWVAFLPSRLSRPVRPVLDSMPADYGRRAPVPNRYFGVFQDGTLKVRGIEARRDDTPPFIAETQMQILDLLSQEETANALPRALALVHHKLAQLRAGRVPLEKLLVSQKLSRALEEYRTPSPPARAAAQLQALGRTLRAGQRVRFHYTRCAPGVHAWDLPEPLNPATLDMDRYATLLLRAAYTVLEPFGVKEISLYEQVHPCPAHQLALPDIHRRVRISLPNPHALHSIAAQSPHS